jgi:hypothetical protein
MFGTDRNDPFAAIDTANARGARNPYLLDGQYILKIHKCGMINGREGKLFFLAELDILASSNPDRPEGLRVSWMTNMKKDMGPVNTKRFLAAAMGIDPDSEDANKQITGDVARIAVSEENPLKDAEIAAQATTITTKAGDPFLDVKWQPVPQPGE